MSVPNASISFEFPNWFGAALQSCHLGMTSGISAEMEEIQMACDEDDGIAEMMNYYCYHQTDKLLGQEEGVWKRRMKKMEHCYKWKNITADKKRDHSVNAHQHCSKRGYQINKNFLWTIQ